MAAASSASPVTNNSAGTRLRKVLTSSGWSGDSAVSVMTGHRRIVKKRWLPTCAYPCSGRARSSGSDGFQAVNVSGESAQTVRQVLVQNPVQQRVFQSDLCRLNRKNQIGQLHLITPPVRRQLPNLRRCLGGRSQVDFLLQAGAQFPPPPPKSMARVTQAADEGLYRVGHFICATDRRC